VRIWSIVVCIDTIVWANPGGGTRRSSGQGRPQCHSRSRTSSRVRSSCRRHSLPPHQIGRCEDALRGIRSASERERGPARGRVGVYPRDPSPYPLVGWGASVPPPSELANRAAEPARRLYRGHLPARPPAQEHQRRHRCDHGHQHRGARSTHRQRRWTRGGEVAGRHQPSPDPRREVRDDRQHVPEQEAVQRTPAIPAAASHAARPHGSTRAGTSAASAAGGLVEARRDPARRCPSLGNRLSLAMEPAPAAVHHLVGEHVVRATAPSSTAACVGEWDRARARPFATMNSSSGMTCRPPGWRVASPTQSSRPAARATPGRRRAVPPPRWRSIAEVAGPGPESVRVQEISPPPLPRPFRAHEAVRQ